MAMPLKQTTKIALQAVAFIAFCRSCCTCIPMTTIVRLLMHN